MSSTIEGFHCIHICNNSINPLPTIRNSLKKQKSLYKEKKDLHAQVNTIIRSEL